MAKTRVRYSNDFKQHAVREATMEGHLLTRTASELGIPPSVLSKWIAMSRKESLPAERVAALSRPELEERVRKLEESVEVLRKLFEGRLMRDAEQKFR